MELGLGWVVAIALVAWFIGGMMGTCAERENWTIRAMQRNRPYTSTAHYCEGKFYYIIEEKYFLSEFQRSSPYSPHDD